MSISNKSVKSAEIVVFPASRRNVQFYNSRIMSEDNYRRTIQAAINVSGNMPGTFIYYAKTGANGKLSEKRIEFFLEGYYVRLQGDDCAAIDAINSKLKEPGGTLWLSLSQAYIAPSNGQNVDSNENFYIKFAELNCADEASGADGVYTFDGLDWGDIKKDTWMNIPLVVPKDGDPTGEGILNPSLLLDNIYKPWFESSATWAASEYSDKNKIWVDDKYGVPHVCKKVSGILKWMPLGAVYKSSNS